MHWLSSAVGKVSDTWPMVWVWYEFESHNCLKHLYIDINYSMLRWMQIIQIERKCKFWRMRLKLRYIFLVKVEPRWGLNYTPLAYGFNPIPTTLQRLDVGMIADSLNITIFVNDLPPGSRRGPNLYLYSALLVGVTSFGHTGGRSQVTSQTHTTCRIVDPKWSRTALSIAQSSTHARTQARKQNGTRARTTHFTLSQQREHIVLSTRLQEPALVQQFCGT